MDIRPLLRRIPFAVRIHVMLLDRARERLEDAPYRHFRKARHRHGAHIADTLRAIEKGPPALDREWKKRIESERKRLMARTEPLVDDTMGKGGLYDEGVTIKDACQVSKRPEPALLLYLLTRTAKPLNVIELGTNVGISSAYIGAALRANAQNGNLITLDASPYRQRIAREVHRNLGLDNISYVNGFFADTLRPTLQQMGHVDMAFIDGHHQYQPTLDYFEQIFAFSSCDTLFVFDDIRWSDGMLKAWSKIQADKRVGLSLDLTSVGICARRRWILSRRYAFGPMDPFQLQ